MSLAAFIGLLVLLEDCVAGGDCFFCLCAHRLAPRLLLRAFDSVLEANGLQCGARAAFCDAGFAFLACRLLRNDFRSGRSGHFSTLGGSIFRR